VNIQKEKQIFWKGAHFEERIRFFGNPITVCVKPLGLPRFLMIGGITISDSQGCLSLFVSEHSERKTEENNEDEGEMETERDTTEQEETLLDNDKQPWLSVIVLPLKHFNYHACFVFSP
jgi:hypothetical protein